MILYGSLISVSPNKAGLFEGRIFWGGVNLTPPPFSPPFMFQEEFI